MTGPPVRLSYSGVWKEVNSETRHDTTIGPSRSLKATFRCQENTTLGQWSNGVTPNLAIGAGEFCSTIICTQRGKTPAGQHRVHLMILPNSWPAKAVTGGPRYLRRNHPVVGNEAAFSLSKEWKVRSPRLQALFYHALGVFGVAVEQLPDLIQSSSHRNARCIGGSILLASSSLLSH